MAHGSSNLVPRLVRSKIMPARLLQLRIMHIFFDFLLEVYKNKIAKSLT